MPDLGRADFFWDDYFWKATVRLPDWRGFQSRRGPYASQDSESSSDGTIEIVFAPTGRDDSPLKDDEIEFVRWAVRNSSEMQRSLLNGLFAAYPSLQEQYDGFVEPEEMPSIRTVDDLRLLIGLHSVTVHQIEKDGVPYVGFEFGCTWDVEHGLGVLMHGTRVVEIGGADTAILLWIAEDDARVST
jgi:hypothetical protein